MDLLAAYHAWTSAPPHVQTLRAHALGALATACPAALAAARTPAIPPETWAHTWGCLDAATGQAAAWAVAAVILDRDVLTFHPAGAAPPAHWLLPYAPGAQHADDPEPPSVDALKALGYARWHEQQVAYQQQLRDRYAEVPMFVTARVTESALADDLRLWAEAVMLAAGYPVASPHPYTRTTSGDARTVRRRVRAIAARLDLRPPTGMGPGGRPRSALPTKFTG